MCCLILKRTDYGKENFNWKSNEAVWNNRRNKDRKLFGIL